MNVAREVILVGTGSVVPADTYLYSVDGEMASLAPSMKVGDLVFYDPRNNITVGPGVTATQVPKLGIAQVVKVNGKVRLRKAFGEYIDSDPKGLTNVTSEPPRCGCNPIVKVLSKCTYQDTDYSITIRVRGDKELDFNAKNRWTEYTESVSLKNFACDACESGVDTKEVFCTLAKRFNDDGSRYSVIKNGGFMKKTLKRQFENKPFYVHPLLEKDYKYEFTNATSSACKNCDLFSPGVKAITIKLWDGTNDKTIQLPNLLDVTDPTKSPNDVKYRLAALITKAFKDNGLSGYAFIEEQLTGAGAGCCGFKLVVNSCKDIELLDGQNGVIAPMEGYPLNPLTMTISKDAECIGCNSSSSWTPDGGLRVIPKPLEIKCDSCSIAERNVFYHTEVEVIQTRGNKNFQPFYVIKEQDVVIPENLGVQLMARMLDMDNGGTGQDYEPWVVENTGLYQTPNSGMAGTEAVQGLKCKGLYCTINFKHHKIYNSVSDGMFEGYKTAKGRTILAIENSNDTLYSAVKAILDPWLASAGFDAVSCTTDIDQVEPVINADSTVDLVTESPNDPLHEVDPKGGLDTGEK